MSSYSRVEMNERHKSLKFIPDNFENKTSTDHLLRAALLNFTGSFLVTCGRISHSSPKRVPFAHINHLFVALHNNWKQYQPDIDGPETVVHPRLVNVSRPGIAKIIRDAHLPPLRRIIPALLDGPDGTVRPLRGDLFESRGNEIAPREDDQREEDAAVVEQHPGMVSFLFRAGFSLVVLTLSGSGQRRCCLASGSKM